MPWRASLLTLSLLAHPTHAQRLPITRYDVAEGFPSGRVNALLQDAHGFLWAGTWEGLARFDGERFVTYARREGLENPLVSSLALDPHGELWAGTFAGLAHLHDEPGPADRTAPFELIPLGTGTTENQILALAFEDATNLWCASETALFHVALAPPHPPVVRPVLREKIAGSASFVREPAGAFWCATDSALLRLERGAVTERIADVPGGAGSIITFVPRSDGATFVLSDRAVHLAEKDRLGTPATWTALPIPFADDVHARCAVLDADGALWIGTTRGLILWQSDAARRLGPADGLSDDIVLALCEDRDRNLWIGTSAQGLERLSTRAIASWNLESGLPSRNVNWIAPASDGALVVSTGRGPVTLRDGRVEPVDAPDGPFVVDQSLHQDRRGDWWLIERGRVHFAPGPRLDLARARTLDARHGLPAGNAYGQIFEDRAGELWIATVPRFLSRLVRTEDGEPRFETTEIPAAQGLESAPRTTLELPNGDVWLAPYRGLWRRRGKVTEPLDLFGDGRAVDFRALLCDARGTVWIGTRFHGAFRVRAPLESRPRCEPVDTVGGFESQAVFALAEDATGRIWFGTGRGLDRLEPDGRLAHFGTADGLAGEIVHHLRVDDRGALWAATSGGLSRLDLSAPELVPAPAAVRFSAVQIAGVPVPIALRGTHTLELGRLSAAQDNLLVEFTAPCLRREHELAFEYRLGPDGFWTPLGARRSLSFAGLAAGRYRVEVRARQGGRPAAPPAVLAFEVAPPFWRTAWFGTLVGCAALLLAWTLHRARVARLVALERVRGQIASDVHDELGAGLAQIAVLSEVARRDATPASAPRLNEVARIARTLRESMSDIVWAVDPRKDSFQSLVERLRPLAHNLFEAGGARVEFAVPADEELGRVALAPDRRRQLFLLLKEALTNAARHAKAAHVRVELARSGRRLRASVRDDGVGFDPGTASDGHGLAGMQRRARALGGELAVRSSAGAGTELAFEVDLGPH